MKNESANKSIDTYEIFNDKKMNLKKNPHKTGKATKKKNITNFEKILKMGMK